MPYTLKESLLVKRFFNRLKHLVINKKDIANKLAIAIKQGSRKNFNDLIKSSKFIDKNYFDEEGNTLVHLMLTLRPKWGETALEDVLKLGCPLTWSNVHNQKPLDCCLSGKNGIWQRNLVRKYAYQQERQYKESQKEILRQFYWEYDKKGKGVRVAPGIYFSFDLSLEYGSKKLSKRCDIPDAWDELDTDHQDLTLHQRLAMAEPFAVSETKDVSELKEDMAPNVKHSRNYAAANIGFVVSTRKHKHDHRRTFITLPIDDPNHHIIRAHDEKLRQHSEVTLYDYLKDILVIRRIVGALCERLRGQWGGYEGYKVYAVVIDIHTSRDMCEPCEKQTYQLQMSRAQNSFLLKLEKVLGEEYGFVLPKVKKFFPELFTPITQRLRCVTRVSSSMFDTYNYDREKDASEIIKVSEKCKRNYDYPVFKENRESIDESEEETSVEEKESEVTPKPKPAFDRDIKKFSNAVIFHTRQSMHDEYGKFFRKKTYHSLGEAGTKSVCFAHQTVFANTNSQTKKHRISPYYKEPLRINLERPSKFDKQAAKEQKALKKS